MFDLGISSVRPCTSQLHDPFRGLNPHRLDFHCGCIAFTSAPPPDLCLDPDDHLEGFSTCDAHTDCGPSA